MNLETHACLSLWRPQLKDLRIRILVNNKNCHGRWTLYNRRTRKTLVKWDPYAFSRGPRDFPEKVREVLIRQLNWINRTDTKLIPAHHLAALLILKEELNDT